MIQQLIESVVNAVGRWLLKMGRILEIGTCAANRIVSRWSLVLLPHGTIMGFVIASTVETLVVQVGVLWLILCPLPVFSVSFAPFVCPLVDTFASFIQLLPALFLKGHFGTVFLEMTWLFAPKTDLVYC